MPSAKCTCTKAVGTFSLPRLDTSANERLVRACGSVARLPSSRTCRSTFHRRSLRPASGSVVSAPTTTWRPSSRNWCWSCRKAKRWGSSRADSFRSKFLHTSWPTRHSTSRRSITRTGIVSTCGTSIPRSTKRSCGPTRWPIIPAKRASSCSTSVSRHRPRGLRQGLPPGKCHPTFSIENPATL